MHRRQCCVHWNILASNEYRCMYSSKIIDVSSIKLALVSRSWNTDIIGRKWNDKRTISLNWSTLPNRNPDFSSVSCFRNKENSRPFVKISRVKSWNCYKKKKKKKEKNELRQCFNRACYFKGKRKYEMPLILDVGIISLGWWTLIFVSRRFAASPQKGEPRRWHFSRETERGRERRI